MYITTYKLDCCLSVPNAAWSRLCYRHLNLQYTETVSYRKLLDDVIPFVCITYLYVQWITKATPR